MCPRRTQRGVEALERRGHHVTFATNALAKSDYTAGTPEQRAADIHEVFENPEIDFVIASIGGYNANDLLNLLDYERIAKNPKPFMGYSDTTVLLYTLRDRAGIQTILGPALLPQFGEFPDMLPFTDASWVAVVEGLGSGKTYELPVASSWTEEFLAWDTSDDRARTLVENPGWHIVSGGSAQGILLGGNIATCTLLLGTDYQPKTEGSILFLEDEGGVTPAILQRHLQQLLQGGFFNKVRGVVFGRFQAGSGMTHELLQEVCSEIFEGMNMPILAGLDFGHTDPMLTLPFGVQVSIDTNPPKIQLVL